MQWRQKQQCDQPFDQPLRRLSKNKPRFDTRAVKQQRNRQQKEAEIVRIEMIADQQRKQYRIPEGDIEGRVVVEEYVGQSAEVGHGLRKNPGKWLLFEVQEESWVLGEHRPS